MLTRIDLPADQPLEGSFHSAFERMVRASNTVNLTVNLKNRLPHDPSVSILNKLSSHSTDSPFLFTKQN